ncbi:RNA helicase [Artemisia annua]|uniref:RNA helicase n=1 Tax=Artemisia annua TaxID=35608 RepID=A0A2U1LRR3_ARTAN|nr:RNA helicase [Artemisia annua]
MVLVHALKSFHICNSTKSTKSEGRRCYAIPTRGAIHGPVGGIPHVPQPGSRGFSAAGRGNTGHLPHQQQQPIGAGIGSSFNFPSMETPNSQPSPGGPLSQPGFVSNDYIKISALLCPVICPLSDDIPTTITDRNVTLY